MVDKRAKPCRYCRTGYKNLWIYWDEEDDEHQVDCGGCGARGPTAESEEEAITVWNKREN